MRIWTYAGSTLALVAFLYAALLFFRTRVVGIDAPGYASTMMTTLMFGGLNLFAIGILGEYIARIYSEVRESPLYVLRSIPSPQGTKLVDRAVFERMAAQEEVHWWFAARCTINRTVIERMINLPDALHILEAGCGTGGNLGMLSDFGALRAFELDDNDRATATQKSGVAVAQGARPTPSHLGLKPSI